MQRVDYDYWWVSIWLPYLKKKFEIFLTFNQKLFWNLRGVQSSCRPPLYPPLLHELIYYFKRLIYLVFYFFFWIPFSCSQIHFKKLKVVIKGSSFCVFFTAIYYFLIVISILGCLFNLDYKLAKVNTSQDTLYLCYLNCVSKKIIAGQTF